MGFGTDKRILALAITRMADALGNPFLIIVLGVAVGPLAAGYLDERGNVDRRYPAGPEYLVYDWTASSGTTCEERPVQPR